MPEFAHWTTLRAAWKTYKPQSSHLTNGSRIVRECRQSPTHVPRAYDKHSISLLLRRQASKGHRRALTGGIDRRDFSGRRKAFHAIRLWSLQGKTFAWCFGSAGGIRAAAALGLEGAERTPQRSVQMELTGALERGVERTEMCSSVKLKVVQHDTRHYVVGLGESHN